MIKKELREANYSKNMSTINHWLREQGFPRYDSLMWETKNNVTHLYFTERRPVAEVHWFSVLLNNVEYFAPYFTFFGEYAGWNKNQLTFWMKHKLVTDVCDYPL